MSFAEKSPLITPELAQQLGLVFSKMTRDAELICIAGDDEKSAEMAVFLKHLVSLSPRLALRILSPGEDPTLDDALDASMLPATGVGGPIPRMVFHGIPGGKEITPFAAAILNAGGGAKDLGWLLMREIEKIRTPRKIQVCVSLSCHHCAQLVRHAQRIAWENPLVTAHMIDAGLYPQLQQRLNLERVPLTVINDTKQVPGGKSMPELLALLRWRCE